MVAIYRSEGRAGQSLRFTWHFVQMVIAMSVGMVVLDVMLVLLGYQGISRRIPEVYTLIMALAMVVPMIAWMRFMMRHGWSRTAEMSAAMTVPIVALVILCAIGILPHTASVAWSMPIMYVAMLADMAYRRRDYATHRGMSLRVVSRRTAA